MLKTIKKSHRVQNVPLGQLTEQGFATVTFNGVTKKLRTSPGLQDRASFYAKKVIEYLNTNARLKLSLNFKSGLRIKEAMDIIKLYAPKGDMKAMLAPLTFYLGECMKTKGAFIWTEDEKGIPYLFSNNPDEAYIHDMYEAIKDYSKKEINQNMILSDTIYTVTQ